ncbi:unnamed protein product [Sphagnum tenellum]
MHNPGDEKRIKAGDRLLLRLQTGGRSFEMVMVLVYLFEGCSAVDAGGGNAHNGLSTRTTAHACNLYRKRLVITPATLRVHELLNHRRVFRWARSHCSYRNSLAGLLEALAF